MDRAHTAKNFVCYRTTRYIKFVNGLLCFFFFLAAYHYRLLLSSAGFLFLSVSWFVILVVTRKQDMLYILSEGGIVDCRRNVYIERGGMVSYEERGADLFLKTTDKGVHRLTLSGMPRRHRRILRAYLEKEIKRDAVP